MKLPHQKIIKKNTWQVFIELNNYKKFIKDTLPHLYKVKLDINYYNTLHIN